MIKTKAQQFKVTNNPITIKNRFRYRTTFSLVYSSLLAIQFRCPLKCFAVCKRSLVGRSFQSFLVELAETEAHSRVAWFTTSYHALNLYMPGISFNRAWQRPVSCLSVSVCIIQMAFTEQLGKAKTVTSTSFVNLKNFFLKSLSF